jgi:putative ABC transport system ATP-binding protein
MSPIRVQRVQLPAVHPILDVTELGQTIVMVTHDPVAASHADGVLFLADGRLAGELEKPTVSAVLDRLGGLEAGR